MSELSMIIKALLDHKLADVSIRLEPSTPGQERITAVSLDGVAAMGPALMAVPYIRDVVQAASEREIQDARRAVAKSMQRALDQNLYSSLGLLKLWEPDITLRLQTIIDQIRWVDIQDRVAERRAKLMGRELFIKSYERWGRGNGNRPKRNHPQRRHHKRS